MDKDPYLLLGVSRDAAEEEIRAAWRRLALELHPDLHPRDESAHERFQDLAAAYQLLRDPLQRRLYDENRRRDAGTVEDRGGVATRLREAFWRTLRELRPAKVPIEGSASSYRLVLTLREWCLGVERTIEVPHFPDCDECGGRGYRASGRVDVCSACDGAGAIWKAGLVFGSWSRCAACAGHGLTGLEECARCAGQGRVEERTALSLDVPAGFAAGRRLRLKGLGQPGRNGGPDGDLLVVPEISADELFVVDGADVRAVVPVPLPVTIIGGELAVPTLEGLQTVRVAPFASERQVVRIRGAGVRTDPPGDLILELVAEWPSELDESQREAVDALARVLGLGPFPAYGQILARYDAAPAAIEGGQESQ